MADRPTCCSPAAMCQLAASESDALSERLWSLYNGRVYGLCGPGYRIICKFAFYYPQYKMNGANNSNPGPCASCLRFHRLCGRQQKFTLSLSHSGSHPHRRHADALRHTLSLNVFPSPPETSGNNMSIGLRLYSMHGWLPPAGLKAAALAYGSLAWGYVHIRPIYWILI